LKDNVVRSAIKIHGGKGRIKNWILENFPPDYQQYNVSIIKQINDVLEKKCTVEPFNNPSQSCITNLLSDLVQFYFDVSSQINRDLVITLADGKTITLHQSEDGSILKTLQILKNNFQLNQNFETLPFKY
jgi:hypothetical protein